jgi:hypothetical protein
MSERETFSSSSLFTPAPVIEQADISEENIFTTSELLSGNPNLSDSNVTFIQGHTLIGLSLSAENPELDDAVLTRNIVFSFNNLVTGQPTVSNSTMFEDETLTASNINSAPPVLDQINMTQGHIFTSEVYSVPPPTVSRGSFTQNNVFSTPNLNTLPPIVPTIIYDAALGRIATEAESRSFAELTIKSGNICVINGQPNKVELVA